MSRTWQPDFGDICDPKFWAALSLETIRVGIRVGGLEKGLLLYNSKIGRLALLSSQNEKVSDVKSLTD